MIAMDHLMEAIEEVICMIDEVHHQDSTMVVIKEDQKKDEITDMAHHHTIKKEEDMIKDHIKEVHLMVSMICKAIQAVSVVMEDLQEVLVDHQVALVVTEDHQEVMVDHLEDLEITKDHQVVLEALQEWTLVMVDHQVVMEEVLVVLLEVADLVVTVVLQVVEAMVAHLEWTLVQIPASAEGIKIIDEVKNLKISVIK